MDYATMFIIACHNDDIHTLNRLMKPEKDHVTMGLALILSSLMGHRNIVEALLDAGADKNTQCKNELNALVWANRTLDSNQVYTMLKNDDDVQSMNMRLAAEEHTDVISGDGNTALMYASDMGHPEVVKMLLKAGADTHVTNDSNYTASMLASRKGNYDIVAMISTVL